MLGNQSLTTAQIKAAENFDILLNNRNFVAMNFDEGKKVKWAENLIVADADYIDHVALLLSVDFERMLGRRVGAADLAQWLVCIALDGGLRAGDNQVQVALVHDKTTSKLENFIPSSLNELNGKAFRDANLGEFAINTVAVEPMTTKDELMADLVAEALEHSEVKRVMVVPDGEEGDSWDLLRQMLHRQTDEAKVVTLFAMQPMPGGNFRQEMLGYSMLQALGIKAEEIQLKVKS